MKNPFSSLDLEPTDKENAHVVKLGLIDESGRYKIGAPTRPTIRHDNGHLAK